MLSSVTGFEKTQYGSALGESKRTNLEHYTCPLTKSLFFFPYQVPGCGHVFELAAISGWVKAGNKQCPIHTCNCTLDADHVRIENGNVRIFQEVNKIIDQNPSLIATRYFCIGFFIKILEKTAINNTEKIFLDRLIKILEENSEILNKIDPIEGCSPLFILCNYEELGHPILENNIKIRKNITFEGLNAPSPANHLKNLTPLCMLLRNKGLAIVAGDPTLRQKIDPKTLSFPAECKSHEGIFPLLYLTQRSEGIQFLRQCPDIVDNISEESLNKVCSRGKYKGVSSVLELVSGSDGLELLSSFPQLRRKIQSNSLEAVSESKSVCEGISPLFILFGTPAGRELINLDKDFFVTTITSKGLNTICLVGPNIGKSPVFLLLCSDICYKLLYTFPVLCQMITLDTLCTPVEEGEDKGTFPLLILADKRMTLLDEPGGLREIITADAWLQTCETGINRGQSAYSILKRKNIALLIRILKSNIFLRHDLGSRISRQDKQFFEQHNISFPLPFHLSEEAPPANSLSFSCSIFLKTIAGLTTGLFGLYMLSLGAPIAITAGICLLGAGFTLFGSAVLQNLRETEAERAAMLPINRSSLINP